MGFRKNLAALALVFTALAAPVGQASAQDNNPAPPKDDASKVSLVVSGVSHHFGQRSYWDADKGQQRPWNEVNPGIGIEYNLGDHWHLSAGTYKNSIYRQSFYVGGGVETNGGKNYGLGADIGAITGYEIPVTPSIVPYLRLGKRDGAFNVKILGIPPIKGLTPAVLAVQALLKIG